MKRAYAPEFDRYILCVSRKSNIEWYYIFANERFNTPYPIVYRGEEPYDSYEWEEKWYEWEI